MIITNLKKEIFFVTGKYVERMFLEYSRCAVAITEKKERTTEQVIGTGVLIKYKHRDIIITARHVVEQ